MQNIPRSITETIKLMKLANHLISTVLFACFFTALSINAIASTSKLRDEAKANLNAGKIKEGLTALIQLSDAGDDDSSYILGMIFAKSKVPQLQRSVTLAEKYLLRGAKNCHQNSLNAIGAYVYKKRGSKLFDPSKAKRLETVCKQGNQIFPSTPKPETTTSETRSNASTSRSDSNDDPIITANVRNAWASQRPSIISFGAGSGVAISSDGVFLTNHHVVNGCSNIAVEYQDMLAKAHIVFADQDIDLAAIRVAAPTPFYATFDGSDLRLGEALVALGYPVNYLFGSEPSVSEGRLTNTDEGKTDLKESGFLLVSIPLASGNSGGPVYNSRGLLRGVVSYGMNNETLSEGLKEQGRDVAIDTVTFNFIVSGLSIMDRLRQKGVSFHERSNSNKKLDVEDLAAMGKMSLANIKCG